MNEDEIKIGTDVEIGNVQPMPGIIIDEANHEVIAGIDIDGDGKQDFSLKLIITNKWFWVIVGAIGLTLVLIKQFGVI